MTERGWIELLGAGGFGALIGWYVYYINRYRKSDVQFSDLTTVIGILGGAAVLNLFPSSTPLFGAYGIGLFLGFFGYFASLLLLIRSSDNFNADFLLDGRRRDLAGTGYYIPGDFVRPAMLPQAMDPPAATRDGNEMRFQAPLMPPDERAMALDDPRHVQATTDALRAATLEAQRTLAALTQAQPGPQPAGSHLEPAPAQGD